MAHYVDDRHQVIHSISYQSKPNTMDTKIHENKGSFCIDALLSKNEERPTSPENTSRSISPTSTRSHSSPPISPGSEEIQQHPFVPRPGLLSHIYPSSNSFYGYQAQPPSSAFHSLDGAMVQKLQLPVTHHNHSQLQQMQLEWFARTGVFYPRLPDLTGMLILFSKACI